MTLDATETRELAALARRAAETAGEVARRGFGHPRTAVDHKGAVDLVTDTDRAIETQLRQELGGGTGFAFLGEEAGWSDRRPGPTWIVDPLDGTTNFVHRVPYFAISIGLWTIDESGERPLAGVVFNPVTRECFWSDGERAWLGDSPLPALAPVDIDGALLATGFPYDRRTNPDDNVGLWRAFMKRGQGIRRMGAAALDVAFLAAGRLDGFWEPRLQPWDLAAGLALARCVGARVTCYDGGDHRLESPDVVAAHPALHAQMLAVIARTRQGDHVET